MPVTGIIFGGTGANRTVTVSPVFGLTGTAEITLALGDGISSVSETFLVTVTENYLSWTRSQGITGALATNDEEKDGLTNLLEYGLGTNALAPDAPPEVMSGNVITFTKGASAIANGDVSWVIESSETLAPGSWTARVTQAAGDPSPTISYTIPPGSPPKTFVRLRVILTP